MRVTLVEHIFSLVSLVSLFILGPALGRALLLWRDKGRERSLPSQHVALAVCTMIAITGLIAIYGVVWKANPSMVTWYSWLSSVPIDGSVSADVSGYVETSH
jgi:hypothetical protein